MSTVDTGADEGAAGSSAPGAQSPLRLRSVQMVLAMEVLGSIGVFAQATALGKLVYDISHRTLDLGLLGLAEFAPAALLVLVTGHVADKRDRRRIVAAALTVEALVALGIAWYAGSAPTAVGPLFAMAFGFGIAKAFLAPASRSLPANVAPAGSLPKVMATFSGMWQSALITGPILGGFLYAGSPSWPFLGASILFLAGAAAVSTVRRRDMHPGEAKAPVVAGPMAVAPIDAVLPDGLLAASRPTEAAGPADVTAADSKTAKAPPERGGLPAALDGLRFIRRTPILLAAISLDLFAVLFGGAVALLPAICEERLHVGSVGLGWLRAAGGIGAVLVAAALVRRPITRRIGRVLLVAVAVFGVCTVLLGITKIYAVAFLAMAMLSAADMVSVFIRGTLVPLVTPDQVRGRVLAAENVFIGASNELGAFESGVSAQLMGTVGSVVLGGIVTVAIAALWWVRFPSLRDVDSFDDLTG